MSRLPVKFRVAPSPPATSRGNEVPAVPAGIGWKLRYRGAYIRTHTHGEGGWENIYIVNSVTSLGIGSRTFAISRVWRTARGPEDLPRVLNGSRRQGRLETNPRIRERLDRGGIKGEEGGPGAKLETPTRTSHVVAVAHRAEKCARADAFRTARRFSTGRLYCAITNLIIRESEHERRDLWQRRICECVSYESRMNEISKNLYVNIYFRGASVNCREIIWYLLYLYCEIIRLLVTEYALWSYNCNIISYCELVHSMFMLKYYSNSRSIRNSLIFRSTVARPRLKIRKQVTLIWIFIRIASRAGNRPSLIGRFKV